CEIAAYSNSIMPIWLLITVFVPILYLPGLGGFEALKIGLLLLASGLLLVLYLDQSYRQGELVLLRPKTSLVIVGLLIYIVGRSFFTIAPNLTWLGSETSHLGAITWLGWLILLLVAANTKISAKGRLLLTMASTIALVGLLLSVLGQITHLSAVEWLSFDDPSRDRTLLGSIGSSSLLGVVLALYMVVIFVSGANIPPKWQPFIKILLIITGVTVIATKSLTGIIVIILVPLMWSNSLRHHLKTSYYWLLFLLILILPLLSPFITQPLTATGWLPSLTDRLQLWQAGLQAVPEHPWFGRGISLYQFDYDQHFPNNRANQQVVTEENPHSIIIGWLVEWGLIGTLFWGTMIYFWFRESRFTKQAAVVWLTIFVVIQLHYVIAASLLIILVSTFLTTDSTAQTTRSLKMKGWLSIILFGIATVWLCLTIITTYSYWQSAYRNNRVGDTTQTLDFAHATQQYRLALTQPLPLAFTQLQFAESYTNEAIKNNSFTDFSPVGEALQQAIKGAPTARHINISLAILNEWSRHGFIEANKLMQEQARLFIGSYAAHPRYSALVAKLRQAGY
ncbi:MAG: O-antigen ligase family protein, partial [bacterium]|nr:O-antigen ligase family protein [bacterium]